MVRSVRTTLPVSILVRSILIVSRWVLYIFRARWETAYQMPSTTSWRRPQFPLFVTRQFSSSGRPFGKQIHIQSPKKRKRGRQGIWVTRIQIGMGRVAHWCPVPSETFFQQTGVFATLRGNCRQMPVGCPPKALVFQHELARLRNGGMGKSPAVVSLEEAIEGGNSLSCFTSAPTSVRPTGTRSAAEAIFLSAGHDEDEFGNNFKAFPPWHAIPYDDDARGNLVHLLDWWWSILPIATLSTTIRL